MTTHRILNRRFDPLRRRTMEDWRRAFARFRVLSAALICASRKIEWDYPIAKPVTRQFVDAYHRLTALPPNRDIEKCLVRLGYHPIQAHRALTVKDRDGTTVNVYGHHLLSLISPAYREEEEDSVSVCLPPARKNPGDSEE
jgi:hypothetical protein